MPGAASGGAYGMLGGGAAPGTARFGPNTGGGADSGIPPWHDNPPLTTGVYATGGPPKQEYAALPKHEYPEPKHEYPLPVQPYPLPVQLPPPLNHRRSRLPNPLPLHPAEYADPEQPKHEAVL